AREAARGAAPVRESDLPPLPDRKRPARACCRPRVRTCRGGGRGAHESDRDGSVVHSPVLRAKKLPRPPDAETLALRQRAAARRISARGRGKPQGLRGLAAALSVGGRQRRYLPLSRNHRLRWPPPPSRSSAC